ncbi:MAG: hypothetical protein H7256_08380 [Bdellovibrio sp.]|nr:hypothetical protein [Bdellovibrio sp.]
MTNQSAFKIILVLSTLFFSNISFATPVVGSVSTATGGTGRGTVEPTDSVLLNPAIVAQIPTKYFSFNYSKDQMGLTISDNGRDALFPAALALNRIEVDHLQTQNIAVAVAYSLLPRLSVGLSVGLVEYSFDNSVNDQKYRQTVGDFGATYAFSKGFAIGLVANKIFSSKSDVDLTLQKQRTMGFGTNYTYQNFVRFRFDVETAPDNKIDRMVYMAGLETFMNDWLIIRFGYQNNNVLAKNFTSAGLGFAGPQFALHYAYLSNPANSDDNRHSVDLGIPF